MTQRYNFSGDPIPETKEETIRTVWRDNKHLWKPEYGPVFKAYDQRISVRPPRVDPGPLAVGDFSLPIYVFQRKSLIMFISGYKERLTFVECDGVIVEGKIDQNGVNTVYLSVERIEEIVADAKRHAVFPA